MAPGLTIPGLLSVAAVAMPLLLAAALAWLPIRSSPPIGRWLPPGLAVLTLAAAAASASPTGGALVAILAATAWLAATLCDALQPAAWPARQAAMTGALVLATFLPADAAIMAAAAASLAAAPARALPLLCAAALAVSAQAAGLPVLAWAGLGLVCLPPAFARPSRGLAMLCGPLAALWVVASQPVGPGVLLATGLAGLLACAAFAGRAALPAVLTAAMALFAVAAAGAGAPIAALLHVALGCLSLIAALTAGWPAVLGMAALAGLPPLGTASSAFAAVLQASGQDIVEAGLLASGALALVLAALPHLPRSAAPAPVTPIGWASLALALAGAWALPAGAVQLLAAAAR